MCPFISVCFCCFVQVFRTRIAFKRTTCNKLCDATFPFRTNENVIASRHVHVHIYLKCETANVRLLKSVLSLGLRTWA